MRTKTIKRLAILIAVLSLVGGTGFFIQQLQVEKMGRSVIKKAELAEKAGDFADGREALRGARPDFSRGCRWRAQACRCDFEGR